MIDPSDADAVYEAGMAALAAGSEAAALQALEAARVFHPRDPRLWHVSGLLHRALGDLAAAVPCCERAAALAPRDFGIVHLRARVALDAGLPAVEPYEQALAIERRDSTLLGHVEALHAERGAAAAIARLEALIAGDPGWIEAHAYLARLRRTAGERERVTQSFERALAARPGDVYLWRELIITLLHARRFEEALAAIARGRAAAGAHAIFDANEAVAIDDLGEHARAERLFAPLAAVDEIDLIVHRVRNQLRLGRPEAAALLAEPRLATDAPLVAPYLSLAWRMTGDPRWQWLEGDERLIGVYDLDVGDLGALAAQLRLLHKGAEEPLDQSVRGGTQTDGNLLSRIEPELQRLRLDLADAVRRHLDQLPPPDPDHPTLRHRRDGPVRFAGSWSVRLPAGGHHGSHFHPEGWFSSAFYAALPEGATGEEGWLRFGAHPEGLEIDLPPTRLIEPKPGRLVLFPSSMWHGTVPFAAGERLSVAFDVAVPRS